MDGFFKGSDWWLILDHLVGLDWERGLPEMWMEIEEQEIVFSPSTKRLLDLQISANSCFQIDLEQHQKCSDISQSSRPP